MTVYTTDELCELLHRDKRFIRLLRKSGLLQGTLLGKGYLYSDKEIKQFFERTKGKTIKNFDDMVLIAQSTISKRLKN